MSTISQQERLSESLYLYYNSIKSGNLEQLKQIMTKESYLIILDSLCFKRAFKDPEIKALLHNIHSDESSLVKIEEIISEDLKNESKNHQIGIVNLEENGPNRAVLHYLEDKHPKKMYFSSSTGTWKIDYKAGRKIN